MASFIAAMQQEMFQLQVNLDAQGAGDDDSQAVLQALVWVSFSVYAMPCIWASDYCLAICEAHLFLPRIYGLFALALLAGFII